MKKFVNGFLFFALSVTLLSGCASTSKTDFDPSSRINVVSREEGSGTRGAFVELFGIEEKDANGNKKDHTTDEAVVVNKTDVMLANVETDPNAIGYTSMGSLPESVKAVSIDGVAPTSEGVKSGTYEIARPFLLVTKGEPDSVTKEFIDFILSKEGQDVVSKGYIPTIDNPAPFQGSSPKGKIVVAGSSSVNPIMEKLKEAYLSINPNATIEIQMSDSTSGITGTMEGTCQIGMASRELKADEADSLDATEIALDGIAVIVNPKNTSTNITSDEVKRIYTGEIKNWSDLSK